MYNDPVYLMKPVFDWLDGLIRDQGDYLYLALVYVSIPLLVWVLTGGLRLHLPRQTHTTAIILIRSTAPPPPLPPDFGGEFLSMSDDDTQSLDA
jgi:hypothetical protein